MFLDNRLVISIVSLHVYASCFALMSVAPVKAKYGVTIGHYMASKKKRWHKHMGLIPENQFMSAAEMSDIMRSNGHDVLIRAISKTLSAAATARQGVNSRRGKYNQGNEYSIYSTSQLLKSLE